MPKKASILETPTARTRVETTTNNNNENGSEDDRGENPSIQPEACDKTRCVEANMEGSEKRANFNDNRGGNIDPSIEEKLDFMQVQVDRIADHEQLLGGGHQSSLRPAPLQHTVVELGHRRMVPQLYEGGFYHRPPKPPGSFAYDMPVMSDVPAAVRALEGWSNERYSTT